MEMQNHKYINRPSRIQIKQLLHSKKNTWQRHTLSFSSKLEGNNNNNNKATQHE